MLNIFEVFSQRAVGVDIADGGIAAAELSREKGEITIVALGRVALPPGVVERGRIRDRGKLRTALTNLFSNTAPSPIVPKHLIFGLPESQVYTRVFELGPHLKADRDRLVSEEAARSIPLRSNELIYSYRALDEGKKPVEILLVAASREVVSEWEGFFRDMGIEVPMFDIETLATFRDLFSNPPASPVMIVDIGAVTSNISVFDSRGLRYAHTLRHAGTNITAEIAEAERLPIEEAEYRKKEIGLGNKDEKLFFVITKAIQPIVDEIKAASLYIQEHFGASLGEIVLVGGGSQLKGLIDYLRFNLNVPVRLGEPRMARGADKTPEAFFYIEAIGLALKGVDRQWLQRDPHITFAPAGVGGEKLFSPGVSGEESERKEKNWIQNHTKEFKLIVILVAGVVLLSGAFWFRAASRERRQEANRQPLLAQEARAVEIAIPVAVLEDAYSDDRVRGRIVENAIQAAGSYDIAVAYSRSLVESKITSGEVIWREPVNKATPEERAAPKFPLAFRWLVYRNEDAIRLIFSGVKERMKSTPNYLLDSTEIRALQETDNTEVMMFDVSANLSFPGGAPK